MVQHVQISRQINEHQYTPIDPHGIGKSERLETRPTVYFFKNRRQAPEADSTESDGPVDWSLFVGTVPAAFFRIFFC